MILNNSYKKVMDKIVLSDELKDKIIKNTSIHSKNEAPKIKYRHIKKITGIAACFVICFLSLYAVTNYYPIQPVEIVSEITPETHPTPSSDDTIEKKVVTENSTQDTCQNDHTENKVVSATIPNKKADVLADNTKNPPINLTTNNEQLKIDNNNKETVTFEQDILTEENQTVTDNSLPPYATRKKVANKNNDSDTKTDISTDISKNKVTSIEQISTELGYEIKSPQKLPEEYNIANMSVVDENIAEIVYQSETDTITYRTSKTVEDISKKDNVCEFMEIVNINNTDVVIKGNQELYYNAVWAENEEAYSINSDNGVEKNIMVDIVSNVNKSVNK